MSIFWATVYMELFDFGCLNCFVPNQSFWTMWLLNIQALIFSNIFSITVGYVQLNTVRNDPKSISKRRINKFQKENQYTEVRFASFLSGWYTTMAVINPPERKLAKRTSVQFCGAPYWSRWYNDGHHYLVVTSLPCRSQKNPVENCPSLVQQLSNVFFLSIQCMVMKFGTWILKY